MMKISRGLLVTWNLLFGLFKYRRFYCTFNGIYFTVDYSLILKCYGCSHRAVKNVEDILQ